MLRLAIASLGAACVAALAAGGSPAGLDGLGLDVSARMQAISGQLGGTGPTTSGPQLHDVVDILRNIRAKLEDIGTA
jgi:hypothetical protein